MALCDSLVIKHLKHAECASSFVSRVGIILFLYRRQEKNIPNYRCTSPSVSRLSAREWRRRVQDDNAHGHTRLFGSSSLPDVIRWTRRRRDLASSTFFFHGSTYFFFFSVRLKKMNAWRARILDAERRLGARDLEARRTFNRALAGGRVALKEEQVENPRR